MTRVTDVHRYLLMFTDIYMYLVSVHLSHFRSLLSYVYVVLLSVCFFATHIDCILRLRNVRPKSIENELQMGFVREFSSYLHKELSMSSVSSSSTTDEKVTDNKVSFVAIHVVSSFFAHEVVSLFLFFLGICTTKSQNMH